MTLKQDEGNPACEEIWPCATVMACWCRLDCHPHLTAWGMLAGAKHTKKNLMPSTSPSTGTIYHWQERVPGRHGGAAVSVAASQLVVRSWALVTVSHRHRFIRVLRFSFRLLNSMLVSISAIQSPLGLNEASVRCVFLTCLQLSEDWLQITNSSQPWPG